MLLFYFWFRFIDITLCISVSNIIKKPTTHNRVMTSWRFSRWRPWHRISTSGFAFRDFAQLGRSKCTCRPNFGEISQSTAKILLLLVLEFYFRFRFLRLRYHLHLPTNFRPNRTTRGGVMTSSIFTRGSAIAEEPRDALRQLKYYGRLLTELLTRSSANPEEPCEHTVS